MSIGLLSEVESLRCLLNHSLIDKGHTATVFGATGFLGRYIVNRLGMRQADTGLENMLMGPATRGCTVVVPFREDMAKRHLKVTGDLGRIIFTVRDTACPCSAS